MANGKNTFYGKAKLIDIRVGEEFTVLLNEHEAWEHGIHAVDKVALVYDDGSEIVVNADLTQHLVETGEVGITTDVAEKYGIQAGEHLGVHFTKRSNEAVNAIKKRLKGEELTDEDIFAIIRDISDNKLTDTMITYYSASNFVKPADNHELYMTAKAMAETGETLKFDGIVADKHCIGGVPGNETTMIIVPTIASLGIKIPKVFSNAITSPAATGECVDVLMNNTFTAKEIEGLVAKNNCSLIRGGGLNLAPADDKIIKVSYPLSMQSYDKMISSIMAKQYAMGINHCLIDIPMGPTAKVSDQATADELIEKFTYVGERLGMKMDVVITPAEQPIGRGIGAVLQVREVLRVLQQHDKRPDDLESKAMYLAAKVVELVGMASGDEALELCYKQLRSGAAREKMQEIIKTQAHATASNKYFDGKPREVQSEDLKRGKIQHKVVAKATGKVKNIDMKYLNVISRTLGTPLEAQAGVYLDKKAGELFTEGEALYTLYSNDQYKLDMALKMLEEKDIYEVE